MSELAEAYDVIAIVCKAHGLDLAIRDIRAAVRPGTRILPLLNGIRHIERLTQCFPEAIVLGGLAHLMVSVAPDGAIQHSNRLHTLRFGGRDGGADPVVGALEDSLSAVPIDARGSATILADMWAKFQMLAALAGVTCLLRAPVGVIAETASGAEIMIEALRETAAIAAAEDFPVSEEHFRTTQALLTEHQSRFSSSMLRDIEAGRPTEAAHIVGDMVERARTRGIAVPTLRIASTHLEAYELARRERMVDQPRATGSTSSPIDPVPSLNPETAPPRSFTKDQGEQHGA